MRLNVKIKNLESDNATLTATQKRSDQRSDILFKLLVKVMTEQEVALCPELEYQTVAEIVERRINQVDILHLSY